MIHLLADDMPLSALGSRIEPAVLYDPTGTRVIGHFTPADPERGRWLYAEHAARLDPDVIARQAAEDPKGRTLEEMKTAFLASRPVFPGGQETEGSAVSAGSEGCCTVIYLPPAEAKRMRIWTVAPDRQAAAVASNQIDRFLKFRPGDLCESCGEGCRLPVVEPLAVVYRVLAEDCRVEVIDVELLTR